MKTATSPNRREITLLGKRDGVPQKESERWREREGGAVASAGCPTPKQKSWIRR